MVLVSFSLRIMVFTDSLWHALERDIGHECRPFLLAECSSISHGAGDVLDRFLKDVREGNVEDGAFNVG